MTGIDSIPQQFKDKLISAFDHGYQIASEWMGRAIQWLKNFPTDMQNRSSVAITVFTVANIVFFTLINQFAYALEERVNSAPQKLSAGDRKLNSFLIDSVVVGGSVLTYNIILSKLTQYPLSKTTLAAITIGAIAVRSLFHLPVENEEITLDDEVLSDKNQPKPVETKKKESPSKKDPIEEKKTQKKDEEVQSTKNAKTDEIDAVEALRQEAQTAFINDFCQELGLVLQGTFQYVNFDEKQKAAQHAFLEQMKTGVAIIEDHADLCRAVNLPHQAAFEKLLCTKLTKGEITEAEVLFLTPLPCTPLRTPRQNIDTNQEAEWKKWTVDIRTQTVRDLREAGAKTVVCYSVDDYKALPDQSEKGKTEYETYEVEQEEEHTVDFPLSTAIPKELIGALYQFTDSNGNRYVLATQGIQIQNHGDTPKECWKMWFGAVDKPEIDARFNEMMDFVQTHQLEVNFEDLKLELSLI